MKAETRNPFVGLIWVLGIPTALVCLAVAALALGLAFGVDPLNSGIEKSRVQALPGTQRMGDRRCFISIDNYNDVQVKADIDVRGVDKSNASTYSTIHAVLPPHAHTRVYPVSPIVNYYEVLSLSIKNY